MNKSPMPSIPEENSATELYNKLMLSIQTITVALEKGSKAGAYGLEESNTIFNHLKFLENIINNSNPSKNVPTVVDDVGASDGDVEVSDGDVEVSGATEI